MFRANIHRRCTIYRQYKKDYKKLKMPYKNQIFDKEDKKYGKNLGIPECQGLRRLRFFV